MKAGLKKLGDRGTTAVSQELSQLHLRDTFEPLNQKNLSSAEHRSALESHLFLKEKRDATVKGQMVAGGNKQRGTIDKVAAHSPTAALESVMLTAAIDAAEGRNVAIVNIPNAFVQTKLEDETDMAIMIMHGRLAELLVQVAPEIYSKFVTINKSGQTVLFVKLKNALLVWLDACCIVVL